MSATKNGWLNSYWSNQQGCVPTSADEFNNVVCCSYNTLKKISQIFTNPSFGDTINSFMGDPQGAISRIIIYPFSFSVGTTGVLGIGTADYDNINVAYPLFNENITHNTLHRLCSIKIEPKFNDFRDYNGYTAIRVYLPFHGYEEVYANEVMGKYLIVCLGIDYRTGEGMYFITTSEIDGDDTSNLRILSKHKCQIGQLIPTTATNALEVGRNLIMGTINTAASIAISAGTGTLTGLATSTTTGTKTFTSSNVHQKRNIKKDKWNVYRRSDKNEKETINRTNVSSHSYTKDTLNDLVSYGTNIFSNSAVHASSDKTMHPALEQFATKQVHIIIERPKYIDMGNYRRFLGSPLFETRSLKNITGYTEIGEIHIENIMGITEDEKGELNSLLHSGVIL